MSAPPRLSLCPERPFGSVKRLFWRCPVYPMPFLPDCFISFYRVTYAFEDDTYFLIARRFIEGGDANKASSVFLARVYLVVLYFLRFPTPPTIPISPRHPFFPRAMFESPVSGQSSLSWCPLRSSCFSVVPYLRIIVAYRRMPRPSCHPRLDNTSFELFEDHS